MATQVIVCNPFLLKTGLSMSGNLVASASLRLFRNAISPTNSSTFGDFAECGFGGYAPIPFTAKSARVRLVVSGDVLVPFTVFTFHNSSGPNDTAQGWYVTNAGSEVLLAQLFPLPRDINTGTSIDVLVSFDLLGLNLSCP